MRIGREEVRLVIFVGVCGWIGIYLAVSILSNREHPNHDLIMPPAEYWVEKVR